MQNPGETIQLQADSVEVPCNVSNQLQALIMLYSNAGGPSWVNGTGWSDQATNLTPDLMGPAWDCITPLSNASLPSYCCWFGIECW